MKKVKQFDLAQAIIDYEQGCLSFDEQIDLFQKLIDNGMAWTLPGHYGRAASAYIDAGYCETAGRY